MKAMFRTLKPLAVLAMAAGLVACQTANPSADTLKQRSQVTLGVPVSKVSNVRSDSSTTYFTATTAKGTYDCQVASGGMIAVAGMGLTTPSPTCWKEGQAPVFQ
ncbi:hypothetical protein N5D48_18155 [Pseudomonas sp. GD03858]|uniref:hypothetical protein n=1 Tax=unclassified Pseudomonas TaxID=196821 RepID=UPI00244C3808|nr:MULTISPECIES: hypothetical protein [unclassified Pseudomonas]MDH0648530.1 hypothetical protein [Pseudomonas sp. GD03867]MDH0664331.1 hypothetical protein [Pseudomonas sp. GD03858]